MKRIGILFGSENSFPGALVERINAQNLDGIQAEFVEAGAARLDQAPPYAVIVDRISHDIPFYRAWLKHAAISGTAVINNPFWCSADDKFFNYALASKLGVAVPPTVILPHKMHPHGATEKSLRNLQFPLDWEAVFAYVGEHGYLKPVNGGGWSDVYNVHDREEFFRAYDQSRDLCMMYQKAVDFTAYLRCYVVGRKKVRIMPYDPRRPHAERYIQKPPRYGKKLLHRIEQDSLKLCRALGYDLNTVEFAVENGIPYAIDFMNPAPDADLHSVGPANFDWIVREVADLAIAKAQAAPQASELLWSAFLGAEPAPAKPAKPAKKKAAAKKKAKAARIETKTASEKIEVVAETEAVDQALAEERTEPVELVEAIATEEAAEVADAVEQAEATVETVAEAEAIGIVEAAEQLETAEPAAAIEEVVIVEPAEAVAEAEAIGIVEVAEPLEAAEPAAAVEEVVIVEPAEAVAEAEAIGIVEAAEPLEAAEPAAAVAEAEAAATEPGVGKDATLDPISKLPGL
jgi:predicted transcriptional regulator